MKRSRPITLAALALATAASTAFSASYDPKLFSEMRWRSVGPHRGGRTRATAGVPAQPNVFYIGVVNRSEERRVGKECRSRWSPYH